MHSPCIEYISRPLVAAILNSRGVCNREISEGILAHPDWELSPGIPGDCALQSSDTGYWVCLRSIFLDPSLHSRRICIEIEGTPDQVSASAAMRSGDRRTTVTLVISGEMNCRTVSVRS